MNLIDKITGKDISDEYKRLEKIVKTMPADYKNAWKQITKELWNYSDLTGRNLIPILSGVIAFFTEGIENNTTCETLIGADISAFVDLLVKAHDVKDYRDKWRDKLNNNIEKQLKKEGKWD